MFDILHGGAVGGKPRQGLGQLLQLFLKQVDAVILGAVAADNILGEGIYRVYGLLVDLIVY